jgi:hypothetical protein
MAGSPAYQALWSSGMVRGQEESTKTAALRCVYTYGSVSYLDV